MSHKSKKAIEALRDYLGKDAEGIKLLDAIAREVTELRKQGNAEQERATRAVAVAEESRELRLRAEAQLQQVRQELAHSQALHRQNDDKLVEMRESITKLQAQVEELQPELTEEDLVSSMSAMSANITLPPDLLQFKELAATFNMLRKALPICPEGVAFDTYNLGSLVKNYSPPEMLTLGRFVACLAMFGGSLAITVSRDRTVPPTGLPRGPARHPPSFFRWFRRNFGQPLGVVRLIGDKDRKPIQNNPTFDPDDVYIDEL